MFSKEFRSVPLPTRTVEPGRAAVATANPARQAVATPAERAPTVPASRAAARKRSATIVNARILPSPVKPRRRWPRRILISVATTVLLALAAVLALAVYEVVVWVAVHLVQVVVGAAVLVLLLAWFGLGQVGACPGIHCPGCKCGGR